MKTLFFLFFSFVTFSQEGNAQTMTNDSTYHYFRCFLVSREKISSKGNKPSVKDSIYGTIVTYYGFESHALQLVGTHLYVGFDFLGINLPVYPNGAFIFESNPIPGDYTKTVRIMEIAVPTFTASKDSLPRPWEGQTFFANPDCNCWELVGTNIENILSAQELLSAVGFLSKHASLVQINTVPH